MGFFFAWPVGSWCFVSGCLLGGSPCRRCLIGCSDLVSGARSKHSRDSVQCLGLDSYLSFVCSKARFVRPKGLARA